MLYYKIQKVEKNLKFFPTSDEKSYDEQNMVITPFYTRKIIEAYNQQLTIKTRIFGGKGKEIASRDVITISEESKKRLAAAKSEPGSVNLLTKNQWPQAKGGI